MNNKMIHLTEQNQTEEKPSYTLNTGKIHMSLEDGWHIAREAHDMGRQTIFEKA